MFKTLKTLLLGEPLKSELEGDSHALTKLQALAMLSSDALSSIAYGPEQVILVLIALSEGAIWWSLPIGIGVLVLLISLTISYSQIIHAYPNGGGAYMVSSDNLSPSMGLLAGGSLLIDYMLTVAVSVSSGADAITSAFPAFKDSNLEISIVLVLILMLMNLRGLRESATALFVPVYFFHYIHSLFTNLWTFPNRYWKSHLHRNSSYWTAHIRPDFSLAAACFY